MRFSFRLVLSSLATAAALVLGGSPALAVTDPTPVGPAWVPDGPVHATVQSGGRVYVGGSFTGGVAALDASTGELVWTGATDGDVRALAPAPGGGLLIGGAFTTVDGAAHRKLALLDGTGKAVPTWKAGSGGTVRDIVVVGDTAYFGGAFTAHGGMQQGGLGAVTVADGKNVTAFTASTDGQVYGLATDGNRLFIAGKFTSVDNQPRNQLASVTSPARRWTRGRRRAPAR